MISSSENQHLVQLIFPFAFLFSSVQFSRSVVSDSLRPHESQHARPPCPPPTPITVVFYMEFWTLCILRLSAVLSIKYTISSGLPWRLGGRESACQCRRHGFNPLSRSVGATTTELCAAPTEAHNLLSLWSATREASTPQLECSPPLAATREKPVQQWRLHSQK